MGAISVLAWKCDHCGNIWLSDDKPKRCARCKSRTWDKGSGNAPAGMAGNPMGVGATRTGAVVNAKKAVKERRHVESAPDTSRTGPGGVVAGGTVAVPEKQATAKAMKCPTCGKATMEWGSMRRCAPCNRNY